MIKDTQNLPFVKKLTYALFIGIIISTLSLATVNADIGKRVISLAEVKARAIVGKNIAAKLQKDLFNQNINFQFRNIDEYESVNGTTQMKGDGFCVLTRSNDKLPMKFDVVLGTNVKGDAIINYDFVDFKELSNFAPTMAEDTIAFSLLNKISEDFVTSDVVIAIDGSKGVERLNSVTAYNGKGKVKINNGNWKEFEFSVELESDKQTSKNLYYKVLKTY